MVTPTGMTPYSLTGPPPEWAGGTARHGAHPIDIEPTDLRHPTIVIDELTHETASPGQARADRAEGPQQQDDSISSIGQPHDTELNTPLTRGRLHYNIGTPIDPREAVDIRAALEQQQTQSSVLNQSMLNMQESVAELRKIVLELVAPPPVAAPPGTPPGMGPGGSAAAPAAEPAASAQPAPPRMPLLQAARDGLLQPPTPTGVGGTWRQEPGVPGWQRATVDSNDLADIHYKDVAHPPKYDGSISSWKVWNVKFKSFLMRRDRRWPALLDAVKQRSAETLTEAAATEIFTALDVGTVLAEKFRAQLYEYLEEYTTGLIHTNILYAGASGSLEVWRQMCEEGFSRKDRSLRREYKKLMSPKQSTYDHLKRDIAAWEADLSTYQLAAGYMMEEKDRLMCLDDMCPTELQKHMDTMAVQVRTYAEFKSEIEVFLQNRKRWGPTGKDTLKSLTETPEDPAAPEPELQEDYTPEDAAVMEQCGQLMALVQNKYKGKTRKGLGKGGKGNNGGKAEKPKAPGDGDVDMADARKGRTCYECGELGHIGADCPVRQARVAAGGPARLDKPKGKGKGQSPGGKGWPSQQWWNQAYPGPTQAQWKQWYPAQPAPGAKMLFDAPLQLSSVTADSRPADFIQHLFATPGNAFSLVEKGAKPKQVDTQNVVELDNRFTVLEPGPSDMVINLEDAMKPPSPNVERRRRRRHVTLCGYGRCRGCDIDDCADRGSGEHAKLPLMSQAEAKPLVEETEHDSDEDDKDREWLNELLTENRLPEPTELIAVPSSSPSPGQIPPSTPAPETRPKSKRSAVKARKSKVKASHQSSSDDTEPPTSSTRIEVKELYSAYFDFDQLDDSLRIIGLDHGTFDAELAAKWAKEDLDAEDPVMQEKRRAQEAFAEAELRAQREFVKRGGELKTNGMTNLNALLEFANLSYEKLIDTNNFAHLPGEAQYTLSVFSEVCQKASLRPVTAAKALGTRSGQFEVMSAIVDSGASVPVFHPETAAAYALEESEASRRGAEYEIANGDVLACLGQKRIAVCTVEGTIRGYGSQCADVSKPLQAVRSLVASKHAVCFGLGDGTDHLIINKESGEINRMRDDGINYYQDLLVIPPDKLEEFRSELMAFQNAQGNNGGGHDNPSGSPSPFPRPAR